MVGTIESKHSTQAPARLVLASGSPRRRELLAGLGAAFDVVVPHVDETVLAGEAPETAVARLAKMKAEAVAGGVPGAWVLGSDTLVALGGRPLGKPKDTDEARRMLGELSGKDHAVYTAVALARAGEATEVRVDRTVVRFRALSAGDIDAYVATGEPMDKAGAYAIQGGARAFVSGVDGEESTVIGLPLPSTRELLARAGVSTLAARLAALRERIATAAKGAGRDPSGVTLVAVSKTHPPALLREAYRCGQRDLGESYAQELATKALALGDLGELRWHFVGHLQSNKAKLVAPVASLVHAVDSPALARELAKRAGRTVRVLLEINLGREAQKHGAVPEDAAALARAVAGENGVALEGLMCLPPAGVPARPFFAQLRELRDALQAQLARPLSALSMGMSGDFEDAIAEGATLVRVGTAIFGERE